MDHREAGRLGKIASAAAWQARCQKVREDYLINPKKCAKCGQPVPFRQRLKGLYCSRSCAAKVNGSKFVKRKRTAKRCAICDCLHAMNGDLCRKHEMIKRVESGIAGPYAVRRNLLAFRGSRCESCGGVEWQGKPIPVEMDHIDGDSKNNSLDNLRLICPNCHSQTPTFRSKNKGNGRYARRERYRAGKSS